MKDGNRIINNEYLSIIERKKVLNELLETIQVTNWYCGKISLYFAWANECTIENKSEQRKIRKIFKENGFIAHFFYSKFSVEY